MARNLTINQTYVANGHQVEAQLDPSGLPVTLVLWVSAQHLRSPSHSRLGFIKTPDGWQHKSGNHPHLDDLCEWVDHVGDVICNGRY